MASAPVSVGQLASGVAAQILLVGYLRPERQQPKNILSVRSASAMTDGLIRSRQASRNSPLDRHGTAVVRSADRKDLRVARQQLSATRQSGIKEVPVVGLPEEFPLPVVAAVANTIHIFLVSGPREPGSGHFLGEVHATKPDKV